MSFTLQSLRAASRTASPSLRLFAGARQTRGVATKAEDVLKYLKESSIISDVLPSSFKPRVQLSARFLSSGEEARFGNLLTPVDAQGKPAIEVLPFPGEGSIPKELEGKKAYIVMTDPDAPKADAPEWSEYAHWIGSTTLPSGEGGEIVIKGKDYSDLLKYEQPAPPEGTGKHRYALVLLTGEGGDAKAPSERKKWGNDKERTGVQKWAEENGLEAIGANFFWSEQKKEQSVDEIHHEDRGLNQGSGYGG